MSVLVSQVVRYKRVVVRDPATAIAYLGNDLLMTEEVGLVLVPDAASAAAAGSAASDDVPFTAERAA